MMAAALGLSLALSPVALAPVYARGAPESFADLAEQVSPAVVMITTTAVVAAPTDGGPVVPKGSPFEEFFKDFSPDGQGQQEPQREQALGSGCVRPMVIS